MRVPATRRHLDWTEVKDMQYKAAKKLGCGVRLLTHMEERDVSNETSSPLIQETTCNQTLPL